MTPKAEDLIPWSEILEEHLQDPEFRAEWERTALARAVAIEVIRYRSEHGLTQTALARLLGMRQPQVSRIEIGEVNPTIDTLVRLASVLGTEFLIDIAPTGDRARLMRPDLERRAASVQRTESRGSRITIATA
jgi:transcriptional regulator with XRE-family HTH domain